MERTARRAVRDLAFAARPAVAPYSNLFLSSSFSAEKSSKNPAKPSRWPVGVHHLRELDQANGCGELGIFDCGSHTPCGLCVCQICWYFENICREVIDAAQKTTATGDENARAEIAKIRFLFESALEQLKRFAQTQVDDGVQCFTLDLFPCKTGIVLQQNHFTRQTISENAAAFFRF